MVAGIGELRASLLTVEAAFHTILCVRGVYDRTTFVRRRKYDVAIFQSTHDGLRAYISEAVAAVVHEIERVRFCCSRTRRR